MARRINPLYEANAKTPLGVSTWTQRVAELLNANFADIETLVAALATTVAEVAAAQAAAAAAQASADAAAGAAATAATAAATAQGSATASSAATALANSYVDAVITATDAGADVTITISAHTRYYPQADGTTTSVAVNGGSITAQPYSTFLYIYYDDAARAGGAVTYLATTSSTTAAQTGDRHCVGSVTTPAALGAPIPGKGVLPSGPGAIP